MIINSTDWKGVDVIVVVVDDFQKAVFRNLHRDIQSRFKILHFEAFHTPAGWTL